MSDQFTELLERFNNVINNSGNRACECPLCSPKQTQQVPTPQQPTPQQQAERYLTTLLDTYMNPVILNQKAAKELHEVWLSKNSIVAICFSKEERAKELQMWETAIMTLDTYVFQAIEDMMNKFIDYVFPLGLTKDEASQMLEEALDATEFDGDADFCNLNYDDCDGCKRNSCPYADTKDSKSSKSSKSDEQKEREREKCSEAVNKSMEELSPLLQSLNLSEEGKADITESLSDLNKFLKAASEGDKEEMDRLNKKADEKIEEYEKKLLEMFKKFEGLK